MSGFDFAIGEWKYVTKQKLEDGTYLDWPEADWKFWYILGTENVQDEFVQPTPDGEVILGTGLRVFSPKLDKWICRGIATGSDGWADYEATDHGDHIIMRGKSLQIPNAYERVTFYEYRENTWRRDLDVSFDQGDTWFEKIATVKARRV